MHGNSNGEPGTSTQYAVTDCPSFDAITNSIDIVGIVPLIFERITLEPPRPFASASSTQFSLPAYRYSRKYNSHVNPNVPPNECPIRKMDFLSPKLYPTNIGTPIKDPLLVQALEQHEARSSKYSKLEGSTWQQCVNTSFKFGTLVIQE